MLGQTIATVGVRTLYITPGSPWEPEAFCVALEAAWTQSRHYSDVLLEARSLNELVRWFRYAAFPLPEDLPDPVTIYRGVQDVTPGGRGGR